MCELPLEELKEFELSKFDKLRSYYKDFNIEDAKKVKDFEAITNHDVKAVEYFIKERMEADVDLDQKKSLFILD